MAGLGLWAAQLGERLVQAGAHALAPGGAAVAGDLHDKIGACMRACGLIGDTTGTTVIVQPPLCMALISWEQLAGRASTDKLARILSPFSHCQTLSHLRRNHHTCLPSSTPTPLLPSGPSPHTDQQDFTLK